MSAGYYDVAQICLNGHVVNDSTRGSPQHNQDFCDKCGAATITECPNCKDSIQGYYVSDVLVLPPPRTPAPSFCKHCGKSFPWTQSKLEAARELTQELDDLTAEEKMELKKSIDDIVMDSPRTTLGATRFKKIMVKVGKEGATALKNILVDIVSEAAKKMIWP